MFHHLRHLHDTPSHSVTSTTSTVPDRPSLYTQLHLLSIPPTYLRITLLRFPAISGPPDLQTTSAFSDPSASYLRNSEIEINRFLQ